MTGATSYASCLPVAAVEGDKLTRTNVVALSARYEGQTFKTAFEVTADRLITRDRHSADGQLRQWTMERVE